MIRLQAIKKCDVFILLQEQIDCGLLQIFSFHLQIGKSPRRNNMYFFFMNGDPEKSANFTAEYDKKSYIAVGNKVLRSVHMHPR